LAASQEELSYMSDIKTSTFGKFLLFPSSSGRDMKKSPYSAAASHT
jgi:hypothetical protein